MLKISEYGTFSTTVTTSGGINDIPVTYVGTYDSVPHLLIVGNNTHAAACGVAVTGTTKTGATVRVQNLTDGGKSPIYKWYAVSEK